MIKEIKGFDIKGMSRGERDFRRIAPKVVGRVALQHFLKGFGNGGGQTDAGKWPPRRRESVKVKIKRGASYSFFSDRLLFQTGDLFSSILVRNATMSLIRIATRGIPYARRHNEGLTDRRGIKMPKREFLGDSRKLDKEIYRTLGNLKKILIG